MADTFLQDVLDQPRAVEATADGLLADGALLGRLAELREKHDAAILTGMGASHAALYGLHLRLTEAGLPSVWTETSELLHYGVDGIGPRCLLIVVSQSGETVEVERLLDRAAGRTTVVGVTNEAESALARRADLTVLLRAGAEGVVATKTYVATLAALRIVGAAMTGQIDGCSASLRTAVSALRTLLDRRDAITLALLETIGVSPGELFLVGRGPSFGSAVAGALIVKEASHTPAEPLSGGHFRHGPLEMVSESTAALVFVPDGRTAQLTWKLAGEIAGYGGRVVAVGPQDRERIAARVPLIETEPVGEHEAPMVEIVVAELLAEALARARGQEPGVFRRMSKVTREE